MSRMKLAFETKLTNQTTSASVASPTVSVTKSKAVKKPADNLLDIDSDEGEERKPPKKKKPKITDHFKPK